MPRALSTVLAFLLLAPAVRAAEPRFWDIESAADFLAGDLQGLSLDAEGRVSLAPATPVLHNPADPFVWALARDAKGAIYAGTGNDGRVLKIVGKEASLFFDAPELEVHAVAIARDGRVFVGTSPDGKVYAVKPNGEAETYFDPGERYIWALAVDKKGNLFVATGDEGKVYRVGTDGKAETLLHGPEEHISSLTLDANGRVFAGSSPGGIVYRIDTDGKVSVLQDTVYREVKSIAVDTDGSVYVAALESKEEPAHVPTPAGTPSPSGGSNAEVTVTETLTAVLAPPLTPGVTPAATPAGNAKGALLKLTPSGDTDTLWSSAEEMPYATLRTPDGILLATGGKGAKLYRITDHHTWTMLAALPAEQVTTLVPDATGRVVVGTSNPGMVYALEGGVGASGTFISKVEDAQSISSWGRIRWHAKIPGGTKVRLATRSGNTDTPDNTWSEWSEAYRDPDGEAITSTGARFLQMKAVLEGKDGASPVLDSIRAAYLQRNLRPRVTSVTVHPPGEVFQKPLSVTGDAEILGFEAPPDDSPDRAAAARQAPSPTAYSRKVYQKGLQTFSWKAEDPNDDSLEYDVEYRPLSDTRFRLLKKGLRESVMVWDTATVPSGRYVIRVIARDSPSNPPEMALSGEMESRAFDIDNTPPTVTATVEGKRVRAVARDDSSIIRRVEYSVDGGSWEEVYPLDGINDSLEEVYQFTPHGENEGPHVVVVRATDLLGNVSTARVEMR